MVGHSPDDVESNGVTERSIDAVFDLLAHDARRAAVACLTSRNRPVALADLAADVADRTSDRPRSERSTEAVSKIQTALHHVHLPKLADAGVVAYDLDDCVVYLAEASPQAECAVSLAKPTVEAE